MQVRAFKRYIPLKYKFIMETLTMTFLTPHFYDRDWSSFTICPPRFFIEIACKPNLWHNFKTGLVHVTF